jgi:putative glutamine amidotransferase
LSIAVGICTAVEQARWAAWNETVTMAPRSYARAVQGAGAVALLLPPDEAAETSVEPYLERIDALLLAGGTDIDPAFYGQTPVDAGAHVTPERDRFEITLTKAALERGMPVLGICRGMQLLNVACGGTLVQHLPDIVGNEDHRHTPGTFSDHQVKLAPGSLAALAVGSERTAVKSHHHQGVDRLGDELIESGWSVADQVVEAIELPSDQHPFALGVLWHPEEDEASRVIATLVEAAQANPAGAPQEVSG